MLYLIILALAAALLWTFVRLVRLQRASRLLHQAVLQKQPLLREDTPGSLDDDLDRLREETNELIAETARLQQQRTGHLAQLDATLGSLREAVLIVDSENHILLANRALQGIFPEATRTLNQRLERVLHSVDFLEYVAQVRRGETPPRAEMEFVAGKQSVWVEVTGTPIPSAQKGGRPWALFVLHDITRQKQLEGIRKEFVANVSHELRTPLAIIKGYIETLVDGHREMPLEDREKFLRTIQRHTERLNSLLQDLLILSRLESINPGLQRESTGFRALVESIVDDYRARPAASEHQIVAEISDNFGELLLDPLKITQVFENLLDNALKYTPKGSVIRIQCSTTDDGVEVRVADNGQGIPAEDLPHIFERFYRVDKGRSRETGGTGLGLSIVKHIIQLHGGRVSVESTVGQGTTFVFTLPIRVS
ncbi:sensor histidine kinase [Nibricoccus sp. IMCC34717]|uniref:sensor histidine kinase n=1 Tax=Nibricoccus sp. IMCC34717 TaxID=3034021 RepID=UPI00384BDECE